MSSTPIASKIIPKAARAHLDPANIEYTSEKQKNAVAALVEEFTVTPELLKSIQKNFMEGMKKGLKKDGETLAMISSYVVGRLDGTEVGSYLALDVGGTNLRVVSVHLNGGGEITTRQTKYRIDEKLKVGDAKSLFDFMAVCVDSFLDEHQIVVRGDAQIELGFTFSFPVLQTAINRGTLITWTKGFNASGMVGKDPVALLQDAFNRRHTPVRVAALVNDTVGTLLAYAYNHPETIMGVILGTGCNGAYIEKISNIEKWKGKTTADEMIVNMEFGAFDKERVILPLTMFDNKMDRKSVNPNKQIFEKMIAGMYLGEITRNILLNLIDRRLLFEGNVSADLNQMWTFETAYMSSIEADHSPTLHETRKILESTLSFPSTTLNDRQIVKTVVELVGKRAARLSAAALAGILEHTGAWKHKSAIGIDGSLFEYYPSFDTDIMDGLEEVFGEEVRKNVSLGLAQDGSGVGAGLCALLAAKNSATKDA
ncbi:hexokinase-domain-containing protein [Gamsiella multidivaricata]|uniref:hexokinase-domain-containing protein n=1 Tax=Gamsiella multidivaricata TaxID=101098 RepID=UPI00221F3C2D|nr:hexokinase-domain-containing protein [Gamsiella multidivaricata]KAG0355515.1 glucokinase [Gamsiella multidivaricata]KAI7822976.1 hexokinase-domain-containing protein [Gamsiella multidivaricata]